MDQSHSREAKLFFEVVEKFAIFLCHLYFNTVFRTAHKLLYSKNRRIHSTSYYLIHLKLIEMLKPHLLLYHQRVSCRLQHKSSRYVHIFVPCVPHALSTYPLVLFAWRNSITQMPVSLTKVKDLFCNFF